MKLTFLGAAHEVTGSCYLLQTGTSNVLIDCGMEQGPDLFENQKIPVDPFNIDAVIVTHAHIDHSGNLPLLYAEGFNGKVFATEATCELCGIMLRDSAHIQEFEAKWRNRKAKRAGKPTYVPVYTMDDAEGVLKKFVPCDYEHEVKVAHGVSVKFVDAGHLLGSASVVLTVTEGESSRTVVFSGDIGNTDKPILKDPEYIEKADFVVIESTYGDRSHGKKPDYVASIAAAIQRTFDRGGNLVIPAFAVGRTQELLYFIKQVKAQNLVKGHPDFPVYLDSPMAVEATTVFGRNSLTCFDEETIAMIEKGINPIGFPGLVTAITSEESKAINDIPGCKIIISASGMCEAGRIRHHLKHNLWRPECTILFVGYQTVGTLGRGLLDGAEKVKLFGETIEVNAEVYQLQGISGHADNEGLVKWISAFDPMPTRVFVTHGENKVCDILKDRFINQLGLVVTAPYNGEQWDLLTDSLVKEGNKVLIEKDKMGGKVPTGKLSAFDKLSAALRRLANLVMAKRNASQEELETLTKDINNICRKWE
ncbi:MAG: MBL fold metallo-hydrolase [Ruminococcaceae bacterium]|nr:MBL fold metallo-hydrolase [Oscillospiraceae bacterium]